MFNFVLAFYNRGCQSQFLRSKMSAFRRYNLNHAIYARKNITVPYDSLDPEQSLSLAKNCAGLLRRLLFMRRVKQSSTAQTSSAIIDNEVCAVEDCLTILANSNLRKILLGVLTCLHIS